MSSDQINPYAAPQSDLRQTPQRSESILEFATKDVYRRGQTLLFLTKHRELPPFCVITNQLVTEREYRYVGFNELNRGEYVNKLPFVMPLCNVYFLGYPIIADTHIMVIIFAIILLLLALVMNFISFFMTKHISIKLGISRQCLDSQFQYLSILVLLFLSLELFLCWLSLYWSTTPVWLLVLLGVFIVPAITTVAIFYLISIYPVGYRLRVIFDKDWLVLHGCGQEFLDRFPEATPEVLQPKPLPNPFED